MRRKKFVEGAAGYWDYTKLADVKKSKKALKGRCFPFLTAR